MRKKLEEFTTQSKILKSEHNETYATLSKEILNFLLVFLMKSLILLLSINTMWAYPIGHLFFSVIC